MENIFGSFVCLIQSFLETLFDFINRIFGLDLAAPDLGCDS